MMTLIKLDGRDDDRISVRKGRATTSCRRPRSSLGILLLLAFSLFSLDLLIKSGEAALSFRRGPPTKRLKQPPALEEERTEYSRRKAPAAVAMLKLRTGEVSIGSLKKGEQFTAIERHDLDNSRNKAIEALELSENKMSETLEPKSVKELKARKEIANRARRAIQEYQNAAIALQRLADDLPLSQKKETVTSHANKAAKDAAGWMAKIEAHELQISRLSSENFLEDVWKRFNGKAHAAIEALKTAEDRTGGQDLGQMREEELIALDEAFNKAGSRLEEYEEAANTLEDLSDLLPLQQKENAKPHVTAAMKNIELWKAKTKADSSQIIWSIALNRLDDLTHARIEAEDALYPLVREEEDGQRVVPLQSMQSLKERMETVKKAVGAVRRYEQAAQRLLEVAPRLPPEKMEIAKVKADVAFRKIPEWRNLIAEALV